VRVLKFVDKPFCVDPASCVSPDIELADIELVGIVADDHCAAKQATRLDAAPKRALGGNLRGIGRDLGRAGAKLVQICLPGCLIGKLLVVRFGQQPDCRSAE